MNFWDHHGILFLGCIAFFPRLTLLLGTAWGGFLWWIGMLLAPRLLVAILATRFYGDTNIVLVVLCWFWCLGGEATEKKKVRTTIINTTATES